MSARSASSTLRYDLLLLAVVSIWGTNFVVVKAIVDLLPTHVLNAARITAAVLALGTYYTVQHVRSGTKFWAPMQEYGRMIVGLGIVGFGLYQVLFIQGLAWTTAGSAALIMASAPLWTAIVGSVIGSERLLRAAWLALGLSFIGTVLVIVAGSSQVGGTLKGNLVMALAALAWGGYTAASRPATEHVAPSALTFFGMLISLPLLYAVAAPAWTEADWSAFGAIEWLAVVYSGALSSGLTLTAWTFCVKRVGASNTAIYSNLVPLVALVTGIIALGETITPVQMAGGVLLLAGLFWKRRMG